MVSALEVRPDRQTLSIGVSDRRDFYHQFKVMEERAASNGLWPLLRLEDVAGMQAWETFQAEAQSKKYDRRRHGEGKLQAWSFVFTSR